MGAAEESADQISGHPSEEGVLGHFQPFYQPQRANLPQVVG